MPGRLEGKVAVITGAGAGIGAAAAARFGREGAKVTCADIDGERAGKVAYGIRAAGGTALGMTVDVTEAAQVQSMADRTLAEFGVIDILYANAGVASAGKAADIEEADWHRAIAINLTGVWRACKAVLPSMVAAGSGSILTQASIGALRAAPSVAAYAASKAGVIGLTRQMAVDYGPAGVRVNAIAPGTVPTELVQEVWSARAGMIPAPGKGQAMTTELFDAQVAKAGAQYPLGRIGSPDDVVNVVLFLASDEAAWVTGAVYVVDGGKTAG